MPRVANSHKQKNRKYKKSTKGNKKALVKGNSKSKPINKSKPIQKTSKVQRIKQQKLKKTREAERMSAANDYLDAQTKGTVAQRIKSQNQVRIVLLLPCNETADVNGLMQIFTKYLKQSESITLKTQLNACRGFPAFQISPNQNKSPIKNRLFVIGTHRDPKQLIDLAKCADIICPVVSVLSANPQRIVQDPSNFGGAFDQAGYSTINLLRSIGLPRVVGLVQHLQKIQPKHKDKIEKFYKRFLVSQFGEQKCMSLESQNDLSTLFRIYDSCSLVNQSWKTQRGYFLTDHIEQQGQDSVVFCGFLKGSCINSNQIAHLTGFEDYQIEKIQIQTIGVKKRVEMQSQELIQFQTIPEELNAFSKPQNNAQQDEDILSAIKGLQLQAYQNQNQKQDEVEEEMNEEGSDNQGDWQSEADQNQNKAEEKAKRVEMQMRKEDQFEFEDEVEYAAEELLRQKFRYFQGLKSFKASQWNQLQNLPNEYDRIYFFKNYNQTHQAAIKDNHSRGFAYPGFYVRVTLKGFQPSKLLGYIDKMPLILSFLLKHERKMTVLHGKVQRNSYYEGECRANSNQLVLVSVGFKRLLVNPIYSRCINGTQKTKFTKYIGEDFDNYYYCTFYGLNYFPPSPFLVFRVNQLFPDQIEGAPLLRGQLVKCDPLHIILERIILTGYPFKINRRRSTVRFMFFNPNDVKYFKPVELRTKMGLRGKIQQSLGTKGLMKVLFNEQVKHNDTVCMHLYKRVFPNPTF